MNIQKLKIMSRSVKSQKEQNYDSYGDSVENWFINLYLIKNNIYI